MVFFFFLSLILQANLIFLHMAFCTVRNATTEEANSTTRKATNKPAYSTHSEFQRPPDVLAERQKKNPKKKKKKVFIFYFLV